MSISPEDMKTFGQPAVLIAALLGILVVGGAVFPRGRLFVPKGRSAVLLAAFLVILILSFFLNYPVNGSMWRDSPWLKSAKQLSQWLVDGSIVYFTLRFVQTWKDFRFALRCCFIGFFLAVCSAGLQIAATFSPSAMTMGLMDVLHSSPLRPWMQQSGRLVLLTFEPGMAGDYLLSIVPLLVCGSFYWKSRQWTVVWSAVSLLLFCGTFSFGSIGALFAAALIVAVLYARRGSKGLLVGVLLLMSVLVTAAVSSSKGQEFIGERLAQVWENGLGPSIPSFSTRQRLAGAEAAFNIFLDHPLTGVGVGKSPFYMYGAYPLWALKQWDVEQSTFDSSAPDGAISFNLFVQMLAETGLVGTAVFVALLLSMLADCYRSMNAATALWKRRAFAGILFALVAQIIHYNAMTWLGMRYWFFVWGLAICATRLLNQRDPKMPEASLGHQEVSFGQREPRPAATAPRIV